MNARSITPFALVLALTAVAGCGEANVTHLRVKATFDAALQVDQLRFTVLDGAEALFQPVTRPETPSGPLPSGSGLVIVLSDGKAGRDLTVRVDGLRSPGATRVVTGTVHATPIAGAGVDVTVPLESPPTSIEVTPPSLTLSVNSSAPLKVTGHLADGSDADVTDQVSWRSSDPTVATVEPGAIATTKTKAGSATLTAALGELENATTIAVTEATLTKLQVTAGTTTLHAGQSVKFAADASFSDGSHKDYTELATWTSSNPTAATVSDRPGSKGTVTAGTGLIAKQATITAAFGAQQGAVMVSVTVP